MRRLYVWLSVAGMFVAISVFAEIRPWKPIGPSTAAIPMVICDLHQAGICFAATETEAALYRTQDGGKNWRLILPRSVFQILTHPLSSNIYLHANGNSGSGLWESTDHGETFTLLSSFRNVAHFAQSPTDPNRIYAIKNDSLQYSKDAGRTWRLLTHLPYRYYIDLTPSPFDANTLYLSGLVLGNHRYDSTPILLVSKDHGGTWDVVRQGGRYQCAYRFFQDPAHPNRVLAYHCGGIDLITPGGLKPLSNIKDTIQLAGLKSGELYALREPGFNGIHAVWRSNDGGATWTLLSKDLQRIRQAIATLGVQRGEESRILLGTAGGLYRCNFDLRCSVSNPGIDIRTATFPVVTTGSSASHILTLARGEIHEDYGSGARGAFLYSSQDRCLHWEDLTVRSGLGDSIRSLVVHPADPNVVLAYPGTFFPLYQELTRDLFISHDGGEHWVHKKTTFDFNKVVFDPTDTNTLYAASLYNYGLPLSKSSDGGNTFQRIRVHQQPGDAISAIIVDRNDPKTLYLTGSVILKSTDGGKIFSRIRIPAERFLEWLPLPQPESYLATDDLSRVWITRDGARNWEHISTIGEQDLDFFPRLYAADVAGQHFFAIKEGRLYESTDGARSWVDITSQFGEHDPWEFYISSLSDPLKTPLYASTSKGLYVQQSQCREAMNFTATEMDDRSLKCFGVSPLGNANQFGRNLMHGTKKQSRLRDALQSGQERVSPIF